MKRAPDMQLKRQVAVRLKEIRTDAGLSQQKFADSIGVSRVHYNRMEAPDIEMMPSRVVIRNICELYEINYDWLMTGNGPIKTDKTETKEIKEETILNVSEITNLNDTLEKQTLEYISLKSANLLKQEELPVQNYISYFQFFSALLNLTFSLLNKIKTYHKQNETIPDELYDSYIEQFKELLDKQKR